MAQATGTSTKDGIGNSPQTLVAIIFCAVLALVTVLGLVAVDWLADLTALNTADSFLQLALTVVFLSVGFAMGDSDAR